MEDRIKFVLGAEVTCVDGPCGDLIRVVIDPTTRVVTYLVVGAAHQQHFGQLVPLRLVKSSVDTVRLSCTQDEFAALERAQFAEFVPDTDDRARTSIGVGEHVMASDGELGGVHGFVVDAHNCDLTHVLLQEDPLGRNGMAIPIGTVVDTSRGIRLDITKQEVADLPLMLVNP